ncbi:motility associated factor glycosyltransferase family protein [Anaerosporobacter sp.]
MLKKLSEILVVNSLLMELIDNVVGYFRKQNYDRGLRKFNLIINNLEKVLLLYDQTIVKLSNYELDYSKESLMNILPEILQAQEDRDYILVSDLLEMRLRPFISKLQEWIMTDLDFIPPNINEEENLQIIRNNDEELYKEVQKEYKGNIGFQCEFTSSGLSTVKCFCDGKEFYLHSNNNPQQEASVLADSWYTEEKHKYIVYGLGLGYHICQLCEQDSYIQLDVYESNLAILQMATVYGVLGRCLASGQVRIHYDPKFKKLSDTLSKLDEDTEFVIHAPSQRLIEEQQIRDRIEEYLLHYQSIKNQKGIMKGNFRSNIKNYDASVDELNSIWKDKYIYIIAAGPSLDKNYQQLRKVGENGIILATSTVYRKLMAAGIRPDYVIVSDGNARIIRQIDGVQQETVPMLILSTAYKEFAKLYKGKKYLVCQDGFTMAEEFAKEMGYHLYQTGGSVSTVALDVAISLGAKRVIFVGLDLAYPDNLVHAEGTSRRHLVDDDDGLKTVKDIDGNYIKTNKHLDMYRRWIEERIDTADSNIEFIDATEGGVFINGTCIMKLEDVV